MQRLSPFLERLIRFLMPLFLGPGIEMDAARVEIIETLASYATRTRAEMINAAQIIAFSMSALDTLSEATTADMSPSMRLRFRGCANGLNRSTQQNEKILDRRRSSDQPIAVRPPAEPVADIIDADVRDALAQAQARIDTARHSLPTTQRGTAAAPVTAALPAAQTGWNTRLWTGAIIDTLQQLGLPAGPPPASA